MFRLHADVKKLTQDVFKNNQAKVAAEYVKIHTKLTTQQLQQHAEATYRAIEQARRGKSQNKFSYAVERDFDLINKLSAELDGLEVLLTRHNIKTTYVNNTIVFAENDGAGAKRKVH